MNQSRELIEYLCVKSHTFNVNRLRVMCTEEGDNNFVFKTIGEALEEASTKSQDAPINTDIISIPKLCFSELVFLYAVYRREGLLNFIYNYEMTWLLYMKRHMKIELLPIFYENNRTTASFELRNTPYQFPFITHSLDEPFPFDEIKYFKTNPEIHKLALEIKYDYIQFKTRMDTSNETPITSDDANELLIGEIGSSDLLKKFMYPDSRILAEVQKRPSLCVYASIAHHYLPKDNFIREFMQACTAREDTIDARARAQARIGTANNWYDEPNTTKDLGPQSSGKGAEYSQNAFRIIRDTPHLHIITESVEPLFAALIACNKTTLEFKGQESSIDIEYLRDAVINGMWCGQVYDETDEHCHNLLTFLMLVLIGSSSGLPMYASRGWRVVSAVWKKMVQTIKTDTWLARYAAQATSGEQKDRGPDVEIKEERLLELIIKVISITHMSDDPNDPVKGFQPGALGYIPYVENYYMRIKSKLGRVKTKAWTGDDESDDTIPEFGGGDESDDDIAVEGGDTGETKVADFRFARRVRFIEEFSFPADIDDIRDAVRFRFADILGIEKRSKVRFV